MPIRRRPFMARFLNNPSSFRYATGAIIGATTLVVLVGSLLMRLLDPDEFETFGEAIWFTLQTVTTVGYGDRVPEDGVGRFVASVVMLGSVGIVTVTTAIVTSLFVSSAARTRFDGDPEDPSIVLARLEATLADLQGQLDRMEQAAGQQPPAPG
jgi:voltage-gated potassium channel